MLGGDQTISLDVDSTLRATAGREPIWRQVLRIRDLLQNILGKTRPNLTFYCPGRACHEFGVTPIHPAAACTLLQLLGTTTPSRALPKDLSPIQELPRLQFPPSISCFSRQHVFTDYPPTALRPQHLHVYSSPPNMGHPPLPDFKSEHELQDDLSLEGQHHDDDDQPKIKGATSIDGADMQRMGKKQELRRNFKFVAIVGFVTILQATWENVLFSTWFGLYNGGTAGVIWCTIATWLLMLCMIASL